MKGGFKKKEKQDLSGGSAILAFTFCFVIFFMSFLFPLSQMFYWTFKFSDNLFDLKIYELLWNTLYLVFLSFFVLIIMSFVSNYGNRVSKSKFLKTKLAIEWYGSKDYRSYFVSFDKIKALGFKGKFTPYDGINDIIKNLESKKIDLGDKTITLEWYENLEKWKKIIDNVTINNKLIKL